VGSPSFPSAEGPAPFPGARPFTEDDHFRFFGRADAARDVARLWRRNRITVLYGDSGVGKTSLVRAGVVPAIAPAAANVLPVGRVSRGSVFPTAALPEQNPYTLALLSSWAPSESPTRLSGMSIGAFLRRHERTDRYGAPLPTLVAIDQAERLLQDTDPGHRDQLFDELLEALDRRPDIHVLLAVREDHLDGLRSVTSLRGEPYAQFGLPPLDQRGALEAVEQPLEKTDRSFAPGVAAQIVGELRGSGAVDSREDDDPDTIEPVLLQVVCRRLWDELPREVRTISKGRVPDLEETLSSFCSEVLATVAADHDRRPADLLAWLRKAFLTPLGEVAAVREGPTHTGGMANSVVHAMEDQHLIKARWRDASRWYELQRPQLGVPIARLEGARWPARPPDAAAQLRAADAALDQGDTDLARWHAKEAIHACGPGDMRVRAEAESVLGNVAHEERDLKGATDHYRAATSLFEALQDTAAVGRLLAAVGRLQLAQGHRADAVGKLEAAVGRMPNDPTVQTGLGEALWDAGQPKAALAVLDGVLRRDGDTPEALRARGEILADMGDAESALRDLDRIDRRTRPSARAARALALATLSRVDAARQELDDTVIKAADSGPVLLRAARVQRLSGDLTTAAELASRALAAENPPLPPHQRVEATRLSQQV
jgi:tetratricopeptide (TPR) repeat protein